MTGIADIENAILARLKSAADQGLLAYGFEALDTYNAQYDTHIQEAKSTLRGTCAWVVFTGCPTAAEETDGNERMGARFALILKTESKRPTNAEQYSRHGYQPDNGPLEPGTYQVHDDAIRLLAGSTLGLDIGRIVIERTGLLSRNEKQRKAGWSLMAVQLRTDYGIDLVTDDADGNFTQFHANYDIPPFGGIGPDLPDDDDADATDNLTLEGAAE